MKMTKAERIFRDTRIECSISLKRGGEMRNPDGRLVGFSNLITEEVCSTRTFNDVQKRIDAEHRVIEIEERLGMELNFEEMRKVLEMVQVTLDNHRARYERDRAFSRA